MSDDIDKFFSQTREAETDLPSEPFRTDLNSRLRLEEELELATPKFNWIPLAIVILATVLAAKFTSLTFWVSAIPHLGISIEQIVLTSLVLLCVGLSSFFLLRWTDG